MSSISEGDTGSEAAVVKPYHQQRGAFHKEGRVGEIAEPLGPPHLELEDLDCDYHCVKHQGRNCWPLEAGDIAHQSVRLGFKSGIKSEWKLEFSLPLPTVHFNLTKNEGNPQNVKEGGKKRRRMREILKMFHILLQLLTIVGAHPTFTRDVFLLTYWHVIIRVIRSTIPIKIIIISCLYFRQITIITIMTLTIHHRHDNQEERILKIATHKTDNEPLLAALSKVNLS